MSKETKVKPISNCYGNQLHTVGELRASMADLDSNDIVCVEGIDLQTGDVADLYPMNLDVIEGIELNDGSIVREVRFCQMMNAAPDTRDKQPIIDALIETFKPMTYTTVLEELLKTIPFEILLQSLPETEWYKYKYIGEPENIWSEIRDDFEDEDKIFIDGYLTGDGDEQGKVIAKIDIVNNEVIYFDERAKTDKKAQELINSRINQIPKSVLSDY